MMNRDSNDERGDGAAALDEVQELAWALLDDNASEAEAQRLAALLSGSESAREDYLRCVELHVGLHEYFAKGTPGGEERPAAAKSPILGFLNGGALPIDVSAPTSNS
jgi:hypothetical protein